MDTQGQRGPRGQAGLDAGLRLRQHSGRGEEKGSGQQRLFTHSWSEHSFSGEEVQDAQQGHLLGRRAWACEVSTSPCGRALCPAG